MLYGGMLACAERGYRMIFELIDTHSTQVEREVNAALSSLRPDGVILTPPHSDNPAIIDLLVAQHMPFARIGSDDASAGFAIKSEEHTSELQSLMRISYAVFCLKKKKIKYKHTNYI